MKNQRSVVSVAVATLVMAWLAGCRQSAQLPTLAATTSPTAAPAVPSALPAATGIAAGTPIATAEASPLMIGAMRAKGYPGSDLNVERILPAGANYNRYSVSYQSDGLKLFGLLTVPTGEEPAGGWPVILLNHGYIPPAEYSTEESYARIVEPMAAANYIVFKPDYRGNGNSEGTPCQPYICPDYVTDSLNALASIKRYPDANPERIGVWGHSMGGNVTLHELVISHDIKAAALMAGVVGSYSDLLDWWKARVANGVLTTQNDIQTDQLVNEMVNLHGTPASNPTFWDPIDPTAFVADVRAPVLIQVGTADTVVPPSFSQELATRLQQAGKSVSLHVYPGADHNLSPDTATAMQEAIVFFDQNLK
ncbi:MAG TPA: alpha/beta fold hydrolase [Anaerolineales bacterium]|nr:alpha/beta fold hydrolase [Anaerolineales bacterium]